MNKTVKDETVSLYETYLKALLREDKEETLISYEGSTLPEVLELGEKRYKKRNFLRGSGKSQRFETVYIEVKTNH